MERIFLIKYGEISLKGENKKHFINLLRNNIKRKLRGIPTIITHRPGRFYLEFKTGSLEQVSRALASTFGIVNFAPAVKVPKDIQKIEAAALEMAGVCYQSQAGRRFKIDCRRTDKKFAFDSYQISCRLGTVLLAAYNDLTVDLNHPDWAIRIEIREHGYVYGREYKGPGGLPVGCAGRGLLLLSGGIDSPVAGYFMGKRGLNVDAVYFHTHPFTSGKTLEKVKKLGQILAVYFNSMRLFIVPFTDVQVTIKEKARANEVTLHSRACMMSIAGLLAARYNHTCLITGESLSQVASQTVESIRFTQSTTDLPVFRPLIGMDKEEIINTARKIDTYETSILPHPDCCTLFAPPHPLIKPDFIRIRQAFQDLELESLLEKSAGNTESIPLDNG